jgi:hypothetical protein
MYDSKKGGIFPKKLIVGLDLVYLKDKVFRVLYTWGSRWVDGDFASNTLTR